jgi:uncharacterized protein (TIGR02217 family)
MSNLMLPALAGQGIKVTRSPVWDTTVQQAISGKETRIARQSYPRWKWEISFAVLRSAGAFQELQQLVGFFNSLQGQWDTFLYQDAEDNAVTGQNLGTGDGATAVFPLVRSFGGFTEPVLAPNAVGNIYINGAALPSSAYGISSWGNANPGYVTFLSGPAAAGAVITADFSFYWPCRMQGDSLDFGKLYSQLHEVKKFSFISVKN